MSSAETCPIFTAKLKSREEIAERTMAFHFEKPVGWAFKAGQFIDMTLLNPSQTDPEAISEAFQSRAPSGRNPDGGYAFARYGFQAGAKGHAPRNRSKD